MKQNIIIVLLTVICCAVGYIAAEVKRQKDEAAEVSAVAADSDFNKIPYKEQIIIDGGYIEINGDTHQKITNPDKKYIQTDTEGAMQIEVIMGTGGEVLLAKIIKSSGSINLDGAAIKAAYSNKSKIMPIKINHENQITKYIFIYTYKIIK